MITRFKICWVCATVSGIWLAMSALIALHIVPRATLEIPIALLMGGSVVGIAYQRYQLRWKISVIAIGMPLAYLLITNLNKKIVIIEIIILLVIAYILFAKKNLADNQSVRDIEKKMKQCC